MTEQELNYACEWLENALPNIEYITNASALRQNKKQFIDTFRKAMTEKTNPLFEQCLANVDPDTKAEVRWNMELTWHKVSEELPMYDVAVIVSYDGNTEDCCFNHRSNNPMVKTTQHDWCEIGYDAEPTHWMYIPEIKED